jgi:hypothetical protein
MSAAAPVAAIGATEFFVLLMTERDAAVATVTGCNVNVGFVNELHGVSSVSEGLAQALSPGPESEKPRRAGLLR